MWCVKKKRFGGLSLRSVSDWNGDEVIEQSREGRAGLAFAGD